MYRRKLILSSSLRNYHIHLFLSPEYRRSNLIFVSYARFTSLSSKYLPLPPDGFISDNPSVGRACCPPGLSLMTEKFLFQANYALATSKIKAA